MNLADANAILRELRTRPVRTLAVFLLILVGVLVLRFLVTLSGEKAREVASQDEVPSLEEAVRITYVRLESAELLSRFLGGMSYSRDARFDATPFIVNNIVYQDLEELLGLLPAERRLGVYTEVQMRALDSGGRNVDSLALENLQVSSSDGETRIRGGRHREQEHYTRLLSEITTIRPQSFTHSHDPQELIRRVEKDPSWVIDYVDMREWMYGAAKSVTELYSYFFVGLPTSQELTGMVADPITQRVAEENPEKDDLAIQKVYYQHAGYMGHIAVREISLLSLDIENISSSPVIVETLTTKTLESGLFSLATGQELTDVLAETEPRAYDPPLDELLPGEHLVVPLRISLGISRAPRRSQWYREEKVIEESTFPKNTNWWKGRPASELSIPVARRLSSTGDLQVGSTALYRQALEGKIDLREAFTDRYYLASSIEAIELSGKTKGGQTSKMSLRKYDPTNVVFRGTDEVGSCPILYAEISGYWERLGPVFPFAVGRNFVMNFLVPLPVGTTRLRLVEEEQEMSFIDGVWLTYHSGELAHQISGSAIELLPVDGEFTKLSPGDQLVIDVPAPTTKGAKVVVRGYYQPLLE